MLRVFRKSPLIMFSLGFTLAALLCLNFVLVILGSITTVALYFMLRGIYGAKTIEDQLMDFIKTGKVASGPTKNPRRF